MDSQDYTRDTCIIVIDTDIGQVGMIVDSVKEVVDLHDSQIEPPPMLGHDRTLTFVRGMGKIEQRVIILVDVVSAFSSEQLNQMASLAA